MKRTSPRTSFSWMPPTITNCSLRFVREQNSRAEWCYIGKTLIFCACLFILVYLVLGFFHLTEQIESVFSIVSFFVDPIPDHSMFWRGGIRHSRGTLHSDLTHNRVGSVGQLRYYYKTSNSIGTILRTRLFLKWNNFDM